MGLRFSERFSELQFSYGFFEHTNSQVRCHEGIAKSLRGSGGILVTTGCILQLYRICAERQYDQRVDVEVHGFVSTIPSSVVRGPL